jgi:hypothetical protein
MSEPDLEAIKGREAAAKAGPWVWKSATIGDDPPVDGNRYLSSPASEWMVIGASQSTMFCDDDDAEFIAAARTDVPDLLEAVERLLSMLIDAETEAQMQAAEVERLRGDDGIVRKLATSTWVYDSYVCINCNALVADVETGEMDEPHEDDCPHALALAYVEANPA